MLSISVRKQNNRNSELLSTLNRKALYAARSQSYSWSHEPTVSNGTQSLTVSSVKNSKMKVASVVLIPMNKLTHIRTIYAVLDSLNRNDAGYMSGVIAHL